MPTFEICQGKQCAGFVIFGVYSDSHLAFLPRDGGFAFTVFVDNVEWAVKDEFNSMLAKERDRFYEEEQELKKLISEYERRRDEYSSLVESLKTKMRLNEKVFRQFEENQQYIDKNILARAINSIDDRRRKSVETINIAKKGSGLDLLITIRRTEGVIEY